jgi:hypothetical protein
VLLEQQTKVVKEVEHLQQIMLAMYLEQVVVVALELLAVTEHLALHLLVVLAALVLVVTLQEQP